MQRVLFLIASTALLALGACGESKLPNPTGKGSVRGINAIPGSPEVAFRIEERLLGAIEYKDATGSSDYDDFSYTFNFDVRYAGDDDFTRVASQELQVVDARDYVFVATGTLDNASVTVWEGDIRDWVGDETDFQLRVGHAAASYGAIDLYFVPDGNAEAPENLEATLSFGEVNAPQDLAEGDYSIVVTASGDINDVLYRSNNISFAAQTTLLLTLFDGDENDLGPLGVRGIQPSGNVSAFADVNTTPTIRFIHASLDFGNADIYEDPALGTPLVTNLAFGESSGDIPVADGDKTITQTVPNDTGVILLESDISVLAGVRVNFYTVGSSGSHQGRMRIVDRRSVDTEARLRIYHASTNHDIVDIYAVDDDASIEEDTFPLRTALTFPAYTNNLPLAAGDYDIYVTPFGDRDTVLAGPFDLSVALGDVVDLILLDTVDTATAELRAIPAP